MLDAEQPCSALASVIDGVWRACAGGYCQIIHCLITKRDAGQGLRFIPGRLSLLKGVGTY